MKTVKDIYQKVDKKRNNICQEIKKLNEDLNTNLFESKIDDLNDVTFNCSMY